MKKEFCSYEQSLALKELGFENEECIFSYKQELFGTDVGAPLIQQAFRFFREKYGLNYFIEYDDNLYVGVIQNSSFVYRFRNYEEAEQACLDKLIELATAQRKQEQYIALTDLMKADEADGLYDLDI